MSIKRFKETDPIETKTLAVFMPTLDALGEDHDDFWNGFATAANLGDVLYTLGRDPLAGVIDPITFRQSFWAIHELYTRPGTFEFYLTVFRAIWGDDVDVIFTIPGPGKLEIGISGELAPIESYLVFREIVGTTYILHPMITQDGGDRILAQGFQGLKTQADANRLIAELAVHGIWTTLTLTLP
jgi:hypothetical protein